MRVLTKEEWFHADGFPIAVEVRDPQEPFGLHSHEFCEMVLVTGGHGLHATHDAHYELCVGDVFVIGRDRPHDYLNMDDLRLINILFDDEKLPMDMGDLSTLPGFHALFSFEPNFREQNRLESPLRLSPGELASATRLVEKLENELNSREPGFRTMAISLFLQLSGFLSRCYSRIGDHGGKSLLALAAVVSHLERHYEQPIKLDQLVQLSGMSRRSFLRMFQSTMGQPPMHYLARLRIRKACELLEQTELPVTDIAMSVGFLDSNYFSRQFRSLVGYSPTEYRTRVDELR